MAILAFFKVSRMDFWYTSYFKGLTVFFEKKKWFIFFCVCSKRFSLKLFSKMNLSQCFTLGVKKKKSDKKISALLEFDHTKSLHHPHHVQELLKYWFYTWPLIYLIVLRYPFELNFSFLQNCFFEMPDLKINSNKKSIQQQYLHLSSNIC